MNLKTSLMFLIAATCLGLPTMVIANSSVHRAPSFNDVAVWVQETDFNGAFASQNDTTGGNGNFATSYDNFILGQNSGLERVSWVGSYFNPPAQGHISGFTITFYSDNGGIPGGAIGIFDVPNSHETFLQNDNLGNPTYSYSQNIDLDLSAGAEYWLSIVPDLGLPPQWGWETGTGGDGAAYQCFFGSCGPIGSDLAFALYIGSDVPLPEPSSALLLGTGLLGLAGAIRRKLRA